MLWVLYVSMALLAIYALLILSFFLGWTKQPLFIPKPDNTLQPISISIVIAARNEAESIEPCLISIMDNNYPKTHFEIILVDDFSEDETVRLAENCLPDNQGKVLRLSQYLNSHQNQSLNAHKKKALEIGIAEAKNELIITTDADCLLPKNWLKSYADCWRQTAAKVIVAPVSFLPFQKKDLLYYFQSLDFMMMQGITAAATRLGVGTMSNGANWAFEKKVFEEVGGYRGVDELASGDDFFLLQKIKKIYPHQITYLKTRKAIAKTKAQPNWSAFFNQRIRWSSKSHKYENKAMIAILSLVYAFNLSFLILFLLGFWAPRYWLFAFNQLLIKTIIEALFLIFVADFYRKSREILYFPFLQPLHIAYIIYTGLRGLMGHYQWKGRKVH